MTISERFLALSRRLAIGALLAVLPLSLWAQEGGPNYIHVVFADVKPSSQASFEAAIKEIGEAQRAAGHPFMHVYQRIRGDNGYTIFGMDPDMNDLAQPNLENPLIMRITGAVDGIRRVTLAMMPEMTIAPPSVEPSGRYMRVVARTVSPGNANAYQALVRDEVIPALRKAGVTDQRGGRVYAGGNRNTFVAFSYSDEFDGGNVDLAQAMGQRQFDSLVERASAMQVSVEDYRYMFRPDLSFTVTQ